VAHGPEVLILSRDREEAKDLRSILQWVETGGEVIIERAAQPVVVP